MHPSPPTRVSSPGSVGGELVVDSSSSSASGSLAEGVVAELLVDDSKKDS